MDLSVSPVSNLSGHVKRECVNARALLLSLSHARTQSSGCREKHPSRPALPRALYEQRSRLPPGGRSAQATRRGSPRDWAGQGQAQGQGQPSLAADSVPQGARAERSSCQRPAWGSAVLAGGDGSGGEHSGHAVTGRPVPPRPLRLGSSSSHGQSLPHGQGRAPPFLCSWAPKQGGGWREGGPAPAPAPLPLPGRGLLSWPWAGRSLPDCDSQWKWCHPRSMLDTCEVSLLVAVTGALQACSGRGPGMLRALPSLG